MRDVERRSQSVTEGVAFALGLEGQPGSEQAQPGS